MINILDLLGSQPLWLGTEGSFQTFLASFMSSTMETTMRHAETERAAWLARRQAVVSARAAALASVKASIAASGVDLKVYDPDEDDDDDEDSEANYFSTAPLTRAGTDGSVGVIQIHGPLVNSDAWYLKYFGQVGYPHIQDSVMRAVNNPSIKSILLDMNTPGGAVGGVDTTAALIRAAGTIKPVNAFSDSTLSGGYWLGSQAEHITGAPLGTEGSIGVLMIHTEYSKMLKDLGINTTVMRKGEYKALAQPTEPLSDKARTELEHAMDVIYDAFTNDVAVGRGVLQQTVKSGMAEGKVFWGAEALQAGLVDQIGNIGDAVAKSEQLAQNRAKAANGAFSLV